VSHGGDDDFPEEHEEHVNHEAWVIPYADLLTLLMAMFIALFAISTVDTGKFQALARGFSNALGGGDLSSGIGGSGKATSPVVGAGNGNGPFGGGTILTTSSNAQISSQTLQHILSELAAGNTMKARDHQTLQDLQNEINNAAQTAGVANKIKTKVLNNGLEVTVLTDHVLFDPGQDTLQPSGDSLLAVIAKVLKTVPNSIDVTGYTDSVPINTVEFPDNYRLSSARAITVVEYFMSNGINAEQLTASGKGAQDPVASNGTPQGRALNRRVVIVVESKLVKQTLDSAGLDNKSAPPTTVPVSNPAGAMKGTVKPNISPGLGAG
jgi:chemotaxis protein MotB